MKNITLIIALCYVIPIYSVTKNDFSELAKQLYKTDWHAKQRFLKKLAPLYNKARTIVSASPGFPFKTILSTDTIFVVEYYAGESALAFGSISNKSNQISYSYQNNSLQIRNGPITTKFQMKLILQWDTVQIRKEVKPPLPQASRLWLIDNLTKIKKDFIA